MTVLLNSPVVCPTCGDRVFVDERGCCPWCDAYLAGDRHVPPARRRAHAGYPVMMSQAQVDEAYGWYVDHGLSVRECARRLLPDTGYASAQSCANALHDQWKLRGYQLRGRIVATITASWKHGRSRRHAKDPQLRHAQKVARGEIRDVRCAALKTQYPEKGRRCRRPALAGEDYCIAHLPARAPQREANLASARARIQPSTGSADSE